MRILPKKWVLIGSISATALLIVWDYIGNAKLCTLNGNLNYHCMDILWGIGTSLFLPVASATFFATTTYWMKEGIYHAWFKFTQVWIPLSIILALIFPSDTGGGGFGPSISFGKADIAAIMSTIYVLVSLVIISYHWMRRK